MKKSLFYVKFSIVIIFISISLINSGCSMQATYSKPIKIPTPDIMPVNYERIAGTLFIAKPNFDVKDMPIALQETITIDNAKLSNNFRKTLLKSFVRSNLFQHVSITEGVDSLFMLETSLNNLSLDVPAFVSDPFKAKVAVEYFIKDYSGKTIKNGVVEAEGIFTEGRGSFSIQAKRNYYYEPIWPALSQSVHEIINEISLDQEVITSLKKYSFSLAKGEEAQTESYNDKPNLLDIDDKNAAIRFGEFYALIIGNNAYKSIPELQTAINDAKAVANILKKHYGFQIELISNGTRRDILSAPDRLRSQLNKKDNLLIYYAGHGYFDKDAERGYWLPIDASDYTTADWISNADISDKLKAIGAKHIMVVADSCYSGTLTRGIKIKIKSSEYLQRMSQKKSRTVLTSGGMEPVTDSGGGKHSVFAKAFIEALNENTGVIDGTRLFTKIRRPVMVNSPQTPQYSDIRFAGHEGGDFLFVRKK